MWHVDEYASDEEIEMSMMQQAVMEIRWIRFFLVCFEPTINSPTNNHK